MYKLGKRSIHRNKIYASLLVLLVLLVVGGIIIAKHNLKSDTILTQAPSVTRHLSVVPPKLKTVTTTLFTMSIPDDWQPRTSNLVPPAPYSWHGTTQEDSARLLDIYVDNIPATLAINRMLPVTATGPKLIIKDAVSDNCANFTDASQENQQTGTALAKWSNVFFYCDLANYERDVVGTSSEGAINSITLTGDQGSHRYFFIYTDNSAAADYSVFTSILSSFEAL
jgi:hypothetical protein